MRFYERMIEVFWDKFVELCIKHNTKPNPVAKELGISSGAVTKWKKEGSQPNSTTLKKIADYFGVSVEYLLEKDNNIKKDLSPKEQLLLSAYNSKPEMQPAVDRLLGIDETETEINKSNNIETYISKTNEPALPPRRIAAAGAAGTKQITPPPPRRIT